MHPHSLYALLLPRLPFVNLGVQYAWQTKRDCPFRSMTCFIPLASSYSSFLASSVYKDSQGLDLASTVSAFPGLRTFVLSDVEAIKFITKERIRFMKPLAIYAALGMFGMNVGITEGSDWTRHRRIVAGPVLADTLNKRAWEETCRTMELCLDDWEATVGKPNQKEVEVSNITSLMLKVSLISFPMVSHCC